MPAPSLNGRLFRSCADVDGGEVGIETTFEYGEHNGEIWAGYQGGAIRRGQLVGTRDGDTLDFRYVQLNTEGRTSSGHCVSTISTLADGRLRLEETWEWESQPGSGTSACEEISRP
ncbi:hypothetical protein [Nonomuraea dietziae]|uniref:hypothetical protein n=1 Tax=Nonomuraea dietziae TaxID=65515 RepID=UPI0033D61A06